jgi:hypothetical protein
MSTPKIKVQFTRTCDVCGTPNVETDEVLCRACKHPQLAKALKRIDEILFDDRMDDFLARVESARLRLATLTRDELVALAATGANLALLDEFCKATLAAHSVALDDDATELAVLVTLIKRIRETTAS